MMRKLFPPIVVALMAIYPASLMLIARARYESTMGLVQKIFYFHMPPAMLMLWSAIFCGVVSGLFLIRKRQIWDHLAVAAAELTVLYGLVSIFSWTLWGRKGWRVGWAV